jgi:uncharacterized protein
MRRLDPPGHEACRLITLADARCVTGTAVFVSDGQGCRLDYSVVCDPAWRTQKANVVGWVGHEAVDFEILVDEQGQWTLNRSECAAVAGCTDIDLNFSPSTNSLPIRRLGGWPSASEPKCAQHGSGFRVFGWNRLCRSTSA